MKLEEFYEELRKLFKEYPGSLMRVLGILYNVYSSLALNDVLSGYAKRYWIKRASMSVVIRDAMDCLMLRKEKMDMAGYIVEALNNLSQEDFDRAFDEIKRRLREVLTSQ
jgi:hypothetical protein